MGIKKKTIYLHIGTSKTGTTSIQYFLWKNKTLLEERGILYPFIFDIGNSEPKALQGANTRPMVIQDYKVVGENKIVSYKKEFMRWNLDVTFKERYNAYKDGFEKYFLDIINNPACYQILLLAKQKNITKRKNKDLKRTFVY